MASERNLSRIPQVSDFGLDLWIEIIILNELSNQDIFNLSVTCQFFSQLLKNEKLVQFANDRRIEYGFYEPEEEKPSNIFSVAWSPDSRILASGDQAGKILLWNAKTGEITSILQRSGFQSPIFSLDFHPHNTNLLAAVSNTKELCLWDIQKKVILVHFVGHTKAVFCLIFHPQGQFIASGSWDGTVQVWHAKTGNCVKKLTDPKSPITCARFTSDGKFLGAACHDSVIFIWKFENFQPFLKIPAYKLQNVGIFFQFFNDNKTLIAINDLDQSVAFFDFAGRIENTKKGFESSMNDYLSVVLHPNQKTAAFGGLKGVQIWNIHTKTLLLEEYDTVQNLSFSPNGRALAIIYPTTYFQVLNTKKYL